MKNTLKQSVQQYYEGQRLDQTQLDQLESIFLGKSPKRKQKVLAQRRYGLVAGLLIAFAVIAGLSGSPFRLTQDHHIREIASEVAKEHLRHKPLEVNSRDFSVVQNHFDKLDFLPSKSSHFGSENLLVGGRYCSILNVTALQIRYHTATLYQVAYDPDHFGQIPNLDDEAAPLIRNINGVQVQIWVENGLLMVVTRNN